MSKSPKQLSISNLKDRNKRCFNRFIWCPLSCLHYTIISITVSILVTSQKTVICRLNKNGNNLYCGVICSQ